VIIKKKKGALNEKKTTPKEKKLRNYMLPPLHLPPITTTTLTITTISGTSAITLSLNLSSDFSISPSHVNCRHHFGFAFTKLELGEVKMVYILILLFG
jgi:hypothetical protein